MTCSSVPLLPRDKIHESHNRIQFIIDILEDLKVDLVEKKLAQYKQKWLNHVSRMLDGYNELETGHHWPNFVTRRTRRRRRRRIIFSSSISLLLPLLFVFLSASPFSSLFLMFIFLSYFLLTFSVFPLSFFPVAHLAAGQAYDKLPCILLNSAEQWRGSHQYVAWQPGKPADVTHCFVTW